MVRMVCFSCLLAVVLGGCATGNGVKADSLRDRAPGKGNIYNVYKKSVEQGKSDAERQAIVGMKKNRVYDLSEPGTPIYQPPKTRTYWLAPRSGEDFMIHGEWITVMTRKGGWAGAPLRGRYLPSRDGTAEQPAFHHLRNATKPKDASIAAKLGLGK